MTQSTTSIQGPMLRLLGPITDALPLGFAALALLTVLCSTAFAVGQDPTGSDGQQGKKFTVDLSEEHVDYASIDGAPIQAGGGDNVLGRAWYQNIEIKGHVAADYLDTGRTGFRPKGSFMFREARLSVEAQATDKVSGYLDLEFARPGRNDDGNVHANEAYLHFREVIDSNPGLLNLKIGAVDIPFGEEYLRRYAIDNPMINYSAAVPYGFDEGILAYGEFRGVSWYASILDGTLARSSDENSDKSYTLKLAGNPFDSLYVSVSGMTTGKTSRSANCFGATFLAPVGTSGLQSSVGTSPSKEILATMYEIDAKLSFGESSYLLAQFGQVHIDDNAPGFDRDLTWFMVEPHIQLTQNVYLSARYSEFGTYHSDEGYTLHGKLTADGRGAFGWDAYRLQRIGLALGYHPHKNLWVKAEVGRDRFWVIEQSPLTPGSDHREYFAFEVLVSF